MPGIRKSLPKNCSPKAFNSNIPGHILKIYNYLQKNYKDIKNIKKKTER